MRIHRDARRSERPSRPLVLSGPTFAVGSRRRRPCPARTAGPRAPDLAHGQLRGRGWSFALRLLILAMVVRRVRLADDTWRDAPVPLPPAGRRAVGAGLSTAAPASSGRALRWVSLRSASRVLWTLSRPASGRRPAQRPGRGVAPAGQSRLRHALAASSLSGRAASPRAGSR